MNKREKKQRLSKLASFFIAFIFVFAFIGFVFFVFLSSNEETSPTKSSEYKSTYNGTINDRVENNVFSFEANTDWKLSPEETNTPSRYTYYGYSYEGLVERKLTVYLGEIPPVALTYLMSVDTLNEAKMKTLELSPYCGSGSEKSTIQQTFSGTAFKCLNNRSQVIVGVAQKNGGIGTKLKDSNGVLKSIGIIYQDSTFTEPKRISFAELDLMSQIVNSFSLK